MNKLVIDGMKKEGKPFLYVMLMGYILAIIMPVSIYLLNNGKFSEKDILLFAIAWFLFGTFGLYGWLYAVKYTIKFNDKKVYLKTLFKKIELNVCDIEKYTCKRYRKSVFYQFQLFIKGKKILIYTRYKDEFRKILEGKKISETIK